MLNLTGKTLKAVGSIAAKDRTRYALNDVSIRPLGDGMTAIEATDGRRLISVTFSANGAKAGRIPQTVHRNVKVKDEIEIEEGVARVTSAMGVTAHATDAEGAFPQTEDILACAGQTPEAVVRVDAKLLGSLLKAFADLATIETGRLPTVDIELHGETSPVVLRGVLGLPEDETGKVLGIIMPCARG